MHMACTLPGLLCTRRLGSRAWCPGVPPGPLLCSRVRGAVTWLLGILGGRDGRLPVPSHWPGRGSARLPPPSAHQSGQAQSRLRSMGSILAPTGVQGGKEHGCLSLGICSHSFLFFFKILFIYS